jgi:hypothetical protein
VFDVRFVFASIGVRRHWCSRSSVLALAFACCTWWPGALALLSPRTPNFEFSEVDQNPNFRSIGRISRHNSEIPQIDRRNLAVLTLDGRIPIWRRRNFRDICPVWP